LLPPPPTYHCAVDPRCPTSANFFSFLSSRSSSLCDLGDVFRLLAKDSLVFFPNHVTTFPARFYLLPPASDSLDHWAFFFPPKDVCDHKITTLRFGFRSLCSPPVCFGSLFPFCWFSSRRAQVASRNLMFDFFLFIVSEDFLFLTPSPHVTRHYLPRAGAHPPLNKLWRPKEE